MVSILRSINEDAKYGKLSVGTSVVELKVGTTMIPGRTGLMVANTSSTASVYIGTDNSVTASNGFPVRAGEHLFLDLVPLQKIYAVSSDTVDVRIIEIH